MRTSYTFLVVLFCTLLYYSCAAGQRVITSANTCVRDADCKEGYEYCDDNYQCRLRLNRNATCRSSYNCMDGLYCADKNGRQFCAPKVPLSGKCSQVSDFPCAMTGETVNKCSILSETCGPFGGVGGRCNVAADCQTGLYCKNRASGNAKCAMKKPNGMPCGVAMGVGRNSFTDPYECQGYCAMDQSNDIGGGVCTSTSGIGQACTESSQCVGFDDAPFDPMMQGKSKIVCNIPKTDIGICVDEQDLIKKEGMKCNPMKDTCDAERGLSCRKTSSGPVCMFNAFDSDVAVIKFCDINGKNSKCNPQDGIPTVCRRNTDPNLDFDFKQFFECHRKIETIKQGSLCSTETFAMCETGTMCKHVPGVLSDTKFCVVENQKGEKCFNNKFKYSCADGLKCENGMCVEGAPDETTTHADRYEDCTALPCMPNTECVMASGFKVCDLKSIEKSKGTCYSTALTTVSCSDGTTCSQNRNGLGLRMCRKKFGVGAVCSEDDNCQSGLQCTGIYPYRRCFNPKLSLPIGAKCNPNATKSGKMCVESDDFRPMSCLPKGKGYVCQKLAELYERCDLSKNVACSPRTKSVCSKQGACVPRM